VPGCGIGTRKYEKESKCKVVCQIKKKEKKACKKSGVGGGGELANINARNAKIGKRTQLFGFATSRWEEKEKKQGRIRRGTKKKIRFSAVWIGCNCRRAWGVKRVQEKSKFVCEIGQGEKNH